MNIYEKLLGMQDKKFKKFNAALIPNIDPETVVGVKTPQLRAMAKELFKAGEYADFISGLPHACFEENQIHAFVLAEIKDFDECRRKVEVFLPYIDNWATCDQLAPKTFGRHKSELLSCIERWICSEHTYTVRFAVNMLMRHFLDEDFHPRYLQMTAEINREDYYVNMVCAWYFATALAKQWEETLPYVTERRLDKWTHNKTVQKALESRRITDEQKQLLRKYKL